MSKMPKKVKEWCEKQEEPALAKMCWFLTSEEGKKAFNEVFKKLKEEDNGSS